MYARLSIIRYLEIDVCVCAVNAFNYPRALRIIFLCNVAFTAVLTTATVQIDPSGERDSSADDLFND